MGIVHPNLARQNCKKVLDYLILIRQFFINKKGKWLIIGLGGDED